MRKREISKRKWNVAHIARHQVLCIRIETRRAQNTWVECLCSSHTRNWKRNRLSLGLSSNCGMLLFSIHLFFVFVFVFVLSFGFVLFVFVLRKQNQFFVVLSDFSLFLSHSLNLSFNSGVLRYHLLLLLLLSVSKWWSIFYSWNCKFRRKKYARIYMNPVTVSEIKSNLLVFDPRLENECEQKKKRTRNLPNKQ